MIRKVYKQVYRGIRQASEGVSLARKFIEHKFRGRHKVMDREIDVSEFERILKGIKEEASLRGKGEMYDRYSLDGSGYDILALLRRDFYPPMDLSLMGMIDEVDREKYGLGIRYRVYHGDHDDRHVLDLGCHISKKGDDGRERRGMTFRNATIDFIVGASVNPHS